MAFRLFSLFFAASDSAAAAVAAAADDATAAAAAAEAAFYSICRVPGSEPEILRPQTCRCANNEPYKLNLFAANICKGDLWFPRVHSLS